MIRFIFAWFGYVKVPKEAVRLSLLQESNIQRWIDIYTSKSMEGWTELFKEYLKAQKCLTEFLQTGRWMQ